MPAEDCAWLARRRLAQHSSNSSFRISHETGRFGRKAGGGRFDRAASDPGWQIPGAVVLIGHNGQVAYRKAFGSRALEPRREAMTVDTIFDLASLTKVIATTTSVMQLVERGKIRPNDTVAKYLPEFGQNGKEDITVRQLLTHYSVWLRIWISRRRGKENRPPTGWRSPTNRRPRRVRGSSTAT